MVLVDTSVWIDHFRRSDQALFDLLDRGNVLMHPFVIGEIACGSLKNRVFILDSLAHLPAATGATDDEVLDLIERERLMGIGIGYVDAHLLASTLLTPEASLWTRDARLNAVAGRLNCRRSP